MLGELLAGLFVLLFLGGLFVLPVAFVAAIYLGVFNIGFTTANLSPERSDVPATVDLDPGEDVVACTQVDRSKWKMLLLVGIALIPVGWGLALIVYARRLSRRPQYVFTRDRLVVEDPESVETYDIEDVGQIQTGASTVESVLDLHHLTFSIDRRQLVTVGYLEDAGTFAERLEELVESAKATTGAETDAVAGGDA